MTNHAKSAKKSHRGAKGLPGLLLGTSFGVVLWLLLMLVTAALLCKTSDPARFVLSAALLLAAAGAFVCGFASVKLSHFRPFVCGITAALALLLFSALLSHISPSDTDSSAVLRVCSGAVIVVFAFFGAFAAGKRKKTGRSRRTPQNRVNKL